jgi:hypothetical protein
MHLKHLTVQNIGRPVGMGQKAQNPMTPLESVNSFMGRGAVVPNAVLAY